jgi:hypothetical protein
MGGESGGKDWRKIMNILYFSDNYTWNNYGTKRSLFEELKNRGKNITWKNKSDIVNILDILHKDNKIYSYIFLAHTKLRIPKNIREQIPIPIIKFSFSDPYLGEPEDMGLKDVYVTNYYDFFIEKKDVMKIIYNPTACDLNFHKKVEVVKDIDISVIGVGKHPRFSDKLNRIRVVELLRERGYKVKVYGKYWTKHKNNYKYITGNDFLSIINRSKIGIDIQDKNSPLAHRMMEYLACGTFCITRERAEVNNIFKVGEEILTYNNDEELLFLIDKYLRKEEERERIANRGMERCIKDHNISNRVNHIFRELNRMGYNI